MALGFKYGNGGGDIIPFVKLTAVPGVSSAAITLPAPGRPPYQLFGPRAPRASFKATGTSSLR